MKPETDRNADDAGMTDISRFQIRFRWCYRRTI